MVIMEHNMENNNYFLKNKNENLQHGPMMILLCNIYQTNLDYLARFKITIEMSLGMSKKV